MSIPESLLKHIEEQLSFKRGEKLKPRQAVAGGDINQAYVLEAGAEKFFLKVNKSSLHTMFAAEARALEIITNADVILCPGVLLHGSKGNSAFLLLQYLELGSTGNGADLGRRLAHLHQVTHDNFGWPENNFIGRTPQKNDSSNNWCEFWLENRLLPQLKMAADKGYSKELATIEEKLIRATQALLQDYQPAASLLLGDLWSGNKAWLRSGEPVIFDPASYYGDRETDLAMTELFGGFGADFYSGYNEVWAIAPGYTQRKDLYNLYHVLNHLNLFGGGYLASSLSLANKIIRAC